jgi:hypothetical protein
MMTTTKTLSFYLVLIVSFLTTARCDLGVETSEATPEATLRTNGLFWYRRSKDMGGGRSLLA